MRSRYVSIFFRGTRKLYNFFPLLWLLLPINASCKNSNVPHDKLIRNSNRLRDCRYELSTRHHSFFFLPTSILLILQRLPFVLIFFSNNRFTTVLALCPSFQSTARMSRKASVAPGASAMKVRDTNLSVRPKHYVVPLPAARWHH